MKSIRPSMSQHERSAIRLHVVLLEHLCLLPDTPVVDQCMMQVINLSFWAPRESHGSDLEEALHAPKPSARLVLAAYSPLSSNLRKSLTYSRAILRLGPPTACLDPSITCWLFGHVRSTWSDNEHA